MIAAHLLRAYRNTSYRAALAEGEISLRVGQCSPVLDALLHARGYQHWAFVTACNPGSRLDETGNPARHARLLAEVEAQVLVHLQGRAIADNGDWPVEESLLILGLDADQARALGRSYGQVAVLAGARGEPVQLLPCEQDASVGDQQG